MMAVGAVVAAVGITEPGHRYIMDSSLATPFPVINNHQTIHGIHIHTMETVVALANLTTVLR
jgi:hypothetical protein